MKRHPLQGIALMSHWRAWYLDFRVWLGLLLFEQPPLRKGVQRRSRLHVVNIGFGQILKMHSSLNEVAAMWFMSRYTGVPVPRLDGIWMRYGTYHSDEGGILNCCIVMRRAEGLPLGVLWKHMLEENQADIISSLRAVVKCLRSLDQPEEMKGQICSFIHGPMLDEGFTVFGPVGPFTQSEFVEYMLNTYIEDREDKEPRFREILSNPKLLQPVLTHGDLHPHNIIVKREGKSGPYKLSAIIDWTTAGWYPMYWEGFKARPVGRRSYWAQPAMEFTGNFHEEVAVLRELHFKEFRW